MHVEVNHTLRVEIPEGTWADFQAEAKAGGHTPRYALYNGLMIRMRCISEAYLLRGVMRACREQLKDSRQSAAQRERTALRLSAAEEEEARLTLCGRIPEGWTITVIGPYLPTQVGLGPLYPPLFAAPFSARTIWPAAPAQDVNWSMRDYTGFLGSWMPPENLGGAGGGRYPGLIQRGCALAVLDGIHYAISTPYDPAFVERLKALPAARWDRRQRAWIVKKRWHRLITEALEAIDALDGERREHLRELCDHLGLSLDRYAWARPREDGGITLDLPPDYAQRGLFALLRELEAIGGIVPARRVENLTLVAEEMDRELTSAWTIHNARQEAREAARARAVQRAFDADAATDAARAEQMAGRLLVPAEEAPRIGAIIDVRGRARRVTSLGRVFGGEEVVTVFGRQITPRTRYVYTEAHGHSDFHSPNTERQP